MVITSPALTMRAPATATPLMLMRPSGAASSSQRPEAGRSEASAGASGAPLASSTSGRIAPEAGSMATREPRCASPSEERKTIVAASEGEGSIGKI